MDSLIPGHETSVLCIGQPKPGLFVNVFLKMFAIMDNLLVEKTNKTPLVSFNTDGHIRISGRSIPEDPLRFYEPLYIWIFEYIANPQLNTIIDIELEYFNSGSSKSILYILREFLDLKNKGLNITFNWFYESGDDDIRERGEYYSSILEIDINIIERK